MTFQDLAPGAWFRFDYTGVVNLRQTANNGGPFVKVGEEWAAPSPQRLGDRWYVPPEARVIRVGGGER